MIRYHMLMHFAQDRGEVSNELLEHFIALPYIHDLIELQHADVMGTGQPQAEREARSNRQFMQQILKEKADEGSGNK